MVFNSIIDIIGNTPIVKLNKVSDLNINLFAKLEFMNPGGSVKDRIGYWLIEDAERRGLLRPGGIIIEGTGGNTGIGLAMAAAVKEYQCIFVLPDKMSDVKVKTLKAYGAQVVIAPSEVPPGDPDSYYSIAKRLAQETPNSFYIDQYNNPANNEQHYRSTGPEILQQLPNIDLFVAGIGTGGTLCGVGKFLKENRPNTSILGVDPIGSVIYETYKSGKAEWHPYLLEGIGKDTVPGNVDFCQLDDIVQVNDEESFIMSRRLLKHEGIYAGVSSGAAVAGAIRWLKSTCGKFKNSNVLIVLPDSGNRYIDKAYNDDWMISNGFAVTQNWATRQES